MGVGHGGGAQAEGVDGRQWALSHGAGDHSGLVWLGLWTGVFFFFWFSFWRLTGRCISSQGFTARTRCHGVFWELPAVFPSPRPSAHRSFLALTYTNYTVKASRYPTSLWKSAPCEKDKNTHSERQRRHRPSSPIGSLQPGHDKGCGSV